MYVYTIEIIFGMHTLKLIILTNLFDISDKKIVVHLYLESTPSTQSSSSQQCTEMRVHRETVSEAI